MDQVIFSSIVRLKHFLLFILEKTVTTDDLTPPIVQNEKCAIARNNKPVAQVRLYEEFTISFEIYPTSYSSTSANLLEFKNHLGVSHLSFWVGESNELSVSNSK